MGRRRRGAAAPARRRRCQRRRGRGGGRPARGRRADGDDAGAGFDAAAASLSQTLSPPVELAGARYAYALAWLDAARVAVRLPGRRDAPSFDLQPWLDARRAALPPPAQAAALGEVHPLAAEAAAAPFAHRVEGPPRYPLGAAAGDAAGGVEPLLALSMRRLARRGSAAHWRRSGAALDAHLLDSGRPGTVWHRLNAEASIPPGTAFVAWAAATDDAEPPDDGDAAAWHAHGFGEAVAAFDPLAFAGPVPRAAWERAPSELPGHPGLAPWTPERDRRGLYGVLLQDATRRVRRIQGRYLWLRVELHGDGRATPDLVALRAWAGRFDYVDHYLPRLYRETLHGDAADAPGEQVATLGAGLTAPRVDEIAAALDAGDAAAPALRDALAALPAGPFGDAAAAAGTASLAVRVDAAGRRWRLVDAAAGRLRHLVREPLADGIGVFRPQATPADFLSRLLAGFEGVLTTLEDRVAAAHLATDPASVPEAGLDWLAGWIGVAFDPVLPAARRRDWLAAAAPLARWHGTRRGLALALDIATGGGVRSGAVVVIEDFRLRRLLATLLGVDLEGDDDPLLPGLHRSGNSVVGDTLVLGEAAGVELLALFRAEVASAGRERRRAGLPRPPVARGDGAGARRGGAAGPRASSAASPSWSRRRTSRCASSGRPGRCWSASPAWSASTPSSARRARRARRASACRRSAWATSWCRTPLSTRGWPARRRRRCPPPRSRAPTPAPTAPCPSARASCSTAAARAPRPAAASPATSGGACRPTPEAARRRPRVPPLPLVPRSPPWRNSQSTPTSPPTTPASR